ncbi:RNA-binding protein [Brasilonema sp. UFV-L1]|nr:RNA-binding protein [Brasilonema sp. UFV-L1]
MWKSFFKAVVNGKKCFEQCENDRDFKIGDHLNLIEVDPENDMKPTGRTCQREIIHILKGERWGLKPGYVLLSFKPVRD